MSHPGQAVGAALKNKLKTHCSNGHPFSEENTAYVGRKTGRICRICRTESNRRGELKRKKKLRGNL